MADSKFHAMSGLQRRQCWQIVVLSLDAALLRETLKSNTKIKWAKSEHMLADCLTKIDVDTTCLDTVLVEGRWTLWPDDRQPRKRPGERRNRKFRSEFEVTSNVYTASVSCLPVQVADYVWANVSKVFDATLAFSACYSRFVRLFLAWTAYSVPAHRDTCHLVLSAWSTEWPRLCGFLFPACARWNVCRNEALNRSKFLLTRVHSRCGSRSCCFFSLSRVSGAGGAVFFSRLRQTVTRVCSLLSAGSR